MLARLRFPEDQSLLRRHPEREASDGYRGPFQRDRDRIVHSRAFRRLAGKTQVTALPGSNHLRTRLTHTIEVAQVSRTIAGVLGLDVDLVEVLALAHDLGHPAFGHQGEATLDQEMQRFGERFDHNSHALRIVEYFEQRYAAFPGLNLTFEVREGLLKHSRELDPEEPAHREYFPNSRPTLEAQLIDPADEIAYLSSDLEDAVRCGFLEVGAICHAVPAFGAIYERLRTEYPRAAPGRILSDAQSRLFGLLARGLIHGTLERATAVGVRDWRDVRECRRRVAGCTEHAQATVASLRELLFASYYMPAAEESHRQGHCARLSELFRFYVRCPEALPAHYAAQVGHRSAHQVACDYVAGMADEFLLRTHAEVLGSGGNDATRIEAA
ncbi:MAG: dNTP triphosphohydrolase [Bryobacterales bacterium]|nr:dNTP triphosphohydrolase [Bryobacterales bacterium]